MGKSKNVAQHREPPPEATGAPQSLEHGAVNTRTHAIQSQTARARKNAPQLTQEPERIRKRYAFLRERLRADASRPACRHICEGVARYHLNVDVSGSH